MEVRTGGIVLSFFFANFPIVLLVMVLCLRLNFDPTALGVRLWRFCAGAGGGIVTRCLVRQGRQRAAVIATRRARMRPLEVE